MKVAYLLLSKFSSALGQINVSLLANDVSVAATHTFDGSHGVRNLAVAINVGVQDTQNMLELLWDNQRLKENRRQLVKSKNNAVIKEMPDLKWLSEVWLLS
jgi:hypothetical protein